MRRIQFSLANLLGSLLFVAIACGLVRLGFDWPGDVRWVAPASIILAAFFVGASIGILMKRPYLGGAVGFCVAIIYMFFAATLFLIYGAG